MENKDYVNIEVAKILKDKNIFIENYLYIVTENIDKDPYGNSYKKGDISHYGFKYNNKVVTLIAPSLYNTQKYLREIYGIYVEPYRDNNNWCYGITDIYGNFNPDNYQDYDLEIPYKSFETYEEALNDGIKYVLNLI